MTIPDDHPRAQSLRLREAIIEGMHKKIVAEAGLIAHGRGEAFDYLLGEQTPTYALKQEEAAVAALLEAENPVISVNGNVAVLCGKELVMLAEEVNAPLEVNLFYNREIRAPLVVEHLKSCGAKEVLGLDEEYHEEIEELSHLRRIVDCRGIYTADVVLVPLEDGDRTMALRKLGKTVITIDLNPLSRTAVWGSITIVNNIIRAVPEMIELAKELRSKDKAERVNILNSYDNYDTLKESIQYIADRLQKLAIKGLEDHRKI
ncbi:MAG: phosphopantothenate/pantothenate synthetase [Candidatus Heimdallarchaeaceae archaeon]